MQFLTVFGRKPKEIKLRQQKYYSSKRTKGKRIQMQVKLGLQGPIFFHYALYSTLFLCEALAKKHHKTGRQTNLTLLTIIWILCPDPHPLDPLHPR